MKEIVINENDASQRLDKFLTKYMPDLPQSMLYKGLRKNFVRINGKHVTQGQHMLQQGDVVTLYFKDEFYKNTPAFVKSEYDINVVFEDIHVLLINKRPGVIVHADNKIGCNTLVDEVKSYLYDKGEFHPEKEHCFSPALCNRLDRNTGGIIIAAKDAASLRIINEKIRSREIRKLYLCITDGHPPKKGILDSYLIRHNKKVSISEKPDENAKQVKTKYRVIAYGRNNSLVEAELLTGRTHQIRAQLAAAGYPLSGDIKYGGSRNKRGSAELPRSFHSYNLCSYRLIFDFKTDAGILNYLSGREFSVPVDFAQRFSDTKL